MSKLLGGMISEYIHNQDHAIPCHAISKEVFEEVIFSSNVIKTLESSRDGAYKK
jgi:hypothetical protein